MRSACPPPPRTTAPRRSRHTTATTGARSLPPAIVGRTGTASSFWVHVTHGDPVGLWLRLEDGSVRTGLRQLENNRAPFDLDGRLVGEATFELPADLPLGYHRLHLQVGSARRDTSTPVIVVPVAAGAARRGWARAARGGWPPSSTACSSERSWGIGDLTDLTDLAVWSAAVHGAGFVLVNPLHAAAPDRRRWNRRRTCRRRVASSIRCICGSRRSRSSPTSGTAGVSARRSGERCRRGPRARADRPRHARGRPNAPRWRASTASKRSAGRDIAYAAYRAREGRSLDDFATWCALAEEYGSDWHQWPEELQHPARPAVAAFAAEHADAVDFHRWLQWQLDDQLTAAQADRRAGGHGARHHARPRGRRGPQRRRRVGAAGRARARRHRGRTARRVQPARAGLVAAAVATRPAGRRRATSRSARWSTRCCGTRAASASTTSSGCSGCGGSRRARRRPRAPTCATTTRR